MKKVTSHGIGYFIDKARVRHIVFDEFASVADDYFHYSNQILFQISSDITASIILLLFINSSGITAALFIESPQLQSRVLYSEFKEIPNAFEGVIERYSGVPP